MFVLAKRWLLTAAALSAPVAAASASDADAGGAAVAPDVATAASGSPPHEVPASVVVRAFAKAEDGALWIAVRVPLGSMRDVSFPLRGPGYVDLEGAAPMLAEQARLWIAEYVRLYEEDVLLPASEVVAARISLPSDPSFRAFESARAHVSAPPLSPETNLMLEQALLDVLMRTPASSVDSRFSVETAWAHLGVRTTTVLGFVTPSGAERIFQYVGDPGRVFLDPRWRQAFLRFVRFGFLHILDGIDHLLFLLCLVIPVRNFWRLVPIVTAFTAAHSITLAASALGLAPDALWFPPLIEMLIAASILYMALENIVGGRSRRRWAWAFGFGLVHGFGFAFVLRDALQFAGSHAVSSLLAFNVGVEIGQAATLLVMAPCLGWLLSKAASQRAAAVVISALAAHASWHWTADGWARLRAYGFRRPAMDSAFAVAALRWALLLVAVGATAWALAGCYRRLAAWRADRDPSATPPPAPRRGAGATPRSGAAGPRT